ncbi:hypothetical protein EJV47_19185 [Hymenobacter gummosus]|uniref:Carboxypeptidase-like regulatory domain-containing protein n=1 Tax=Hymenobacter gummosus TaxID=1776032 RepID=A0A3S0HL97_9BACT|nr:hypothetical protein [Hymenobacter gummosus]RTQ47542.1 hypothetical protein EJV47_19185 [Hymenobacter gummosus]
MPRPSLTLSIPQPCTQSWAQMQPAAGGRHCQSCGHTVVDFSQLTDAEVVAFFERAPATACGRFAAHQLDRPLLGAAPPAPRWRTWLTAAATLVVSTLATFTARGQAAPDLPGAQPHPARAAGRAPKPRPTAPGSLTLRGRIIDAASQEPVPFASLGLVQLGIGALSNEHGYYELTVSAQQLAQQPTDTLLVQGLGYWRHAQLLELPAAATAPVEVQITRRPLGPGSGITVTAGIVVRAPADAPPAPAAPPRKARRRR